MQTTLPDPTHLADNHAHNRADIRAVVFDFGGVLFDWNPHHLYQELIPDAQEREHFLTHVCSSEWNIQQDAGRSLHDGTELLVAQYPQHEALIRAFYARWSEMLQGALDDGVALLRGLHARGVPVFGLTNWSDETFPYALANYDFLQLFRDIVVSGAEKCIKPDDIIYQIALERYRQHLPDLQPQQIVFIDDLARNVEAARRLGWHAIQHVDCQQTIRQLQALGVPA
ncbi:2-haloacid dehalogenase [Herbaspirillum sp. Sphag1AN]|uniref:HAD family hydrolase n=1 Tax=unclassified Herbaspirillum TaxID=2624150 RepID=UPI0016086E28|nr:MULTISPECIES: HAD family phosphatase [unclassified Herbaspirillum]MBB3213568.1 2-haloacid dehalogenase [Herbaspirillum sp. Sphag1AN]MBB3246766.1 2-haloacid dehalogenase [Herbaspirillum sp. Sphag64]